MIEFVTGPDDRRHQEDDGDDFYFDDSEIDPEVEWDQAGRSVKSAVPAEFAMVLLDGGEDDDDSQMAPEDPGDKKKEEKNERQAESKEAKETKEVKEKDLVSQLPKESLDSIRRAMLALQKVKPGEQIPSEVREEFVKAIRDAGRIDPKFAAEQEEKLTEDLKTKERKLQTGLTLPVWTPEKEKEYWEKKGAANKALVDVPEPTRGRVAALEVQRGATTDLLVRARLEQTINAALNAEQSPKATTYLLARRAAEQFEKDNALGIIRRNMHQQEMMLLHSSQLCNGLYAIAMDRARQPQDKKAIEEHLQKSAFDQFTVLNVPELEELREKCKVKEADPLDAKIPGRAELKQALDIMRDEKLGTMKERLEKAKPLYEKAIELSNKLDTKKLDDELKAVVKERADMGEGGDPKRREELARKAVELLEAVRFTGVSRFAFAQALNHTAVEAKEPALNKQAIDLIKKLLEKEPGYQYDPLAQGFLKLAEESPLKKINEEDAIKVGEPIVEKLKKEHKENGGGPKPEQLPWWREGLNFIVSTAAFMAAWWALGKVFSPVGKYASHLRRQVELSSRLKNLSTEASKDMKPGEKPQLFYRDKEGKDFPVEGVRKEDGTLRIKKDGKTEVVEHKGKLVLKHPEGEVPTAEQAKEAANKVLAPTSEEHEIENARKEAEKAKQEAEKNLSEAQKKEAENAELRRRVEELEQRLKQQNGSEAKPSETGKALAEKLPKRVREKPPTEYSPDVKEAMDRALEANRDKWPEPERKSFEKLIADYEKKDTKAIEEVNRMLRDASTTSEGGPRTSPGGADTGSRSGGGTSVGGETVAKPPSEVHRTGGEHHTVDPRPAERVQAQAIETLTSRDGIKYIESIPVGELTVAKVEQKMKDIDKEIKAAKEKGLHDYARELEQLKEEYHKQPGAKEKQAFCERAVERVKEAHEQARGAKEGGGKGLAGKAGTVVAVLMVAGWLLDVTAPSSVTNSSSRRVMPSKQ